jgi:hypothetical protein
VTTTAILNVILALGVIVMVVAPLVWAIFTQHRDHARPATTDGAPARSPRPQPRRASPPSYRPVIDRA